MFSPDIMDRPTMFGPIHIVKSYSYSPYRFVEKYEFIIILFDHVNNSIYCEYGGMCGQAVLEEVLHNLIWGSVG